MDYLNFALPCNDSWPIHYSQPRSCRMSEDRSQMFMRFLVATVSQKLIEVEANAFDLQI